MFDEKEWNCIKMFTFSKQIFLSTLMYFASLWIVNPLECISMKNQERKVRPEIFNINSNNPIFYPLRQINVVVIVIILMTHMQKFVFLIL